MSRKMLAAMRKASRMMQPARLRSLGKVIKHLRQAQTAMLGTPPKAVSAPVRQAAGARFVARSHRSAGGSRAYKLYLPASHPRRPRGLILMLHGCNQTPDDFARGTHMNAEAEKHGLAVVYPAQTARDNAGSCWNWFRPGDQERGAGEPAELASLTRKLMKDWQLPRGSVFVAGLSAGGAMAAILAETYPDLFSAAAVHSGLARGAARDVLSAMSAMRSGSRAEAMVPETGPPVRWIVFHGDADSTVDVSNAARIVAGVLGDVAGPVRVSERSVRGRGYARSDYARPDGVIRLQMWLLKGAGHAWSGGRAAGSYTDPKGPDATALMVRFFLAAPG